MDDVDAILVVSFGGPERSEDVMPFLRNVVRGKNVPDARLQVVAEHYEMFGGVSPINEANRRLIEALTQELDGHGIELPIYWGNRNWHPFLKDTLETMTERGVRSALAFVTSAYSSYSSCRQYLEDIERARAEVGADAPRVEKLPPFYNHPGFIEANRARLDEALASLGAARPTVLFTAHSLPLSMADTCDYQAQLEETARLVLGDKALPSRLVYQSRSGPPTQPWLEPDILDALRELHTDGVTDVVIAPIGFVSDHMEVVYDLDFEAKNLAQELGLSLARAQTAGDHPRFTEMVRELIEERSRSGPVLCDPNCCPAPRRRP